MPFLRDELVSGDKLVSHGLFIELIKNNRNFRIKALEMDSIFIMYTTNNEQ